MPTTALAHPPATPYTPADVLRRAADAYRTKEISFGQHWFIDEDDGTRCALGAITYAVDPDNLDGNPTFAGPAANGAAVALAEHLDGYRCLYGDGSLDPTETVGSWNDELERVVGDVIAALDAAAERLESAMSGGAA